MFGNGVNGEGVRLWLTGSVLETVAPELTVGAVPVGPVTGAVEFVNGNGTDVEFPVGRAEAVPVLAKGVEDNEPVTLVDGAVSVPPRPVLVKVAFGNG